MSKKEEALPTHCPHCSKQLVMVEYALPHPEHIDGWSELDCPDYKGCGYRIGRWTKQEIPPGHCESRFGTRGIIRATLGENKRR